MSQICIIAILQVQECPILTKTLKLTILTLKAQIHCSYINICISTKYFLKTVCLGFVLKIEKLCVSVIA